MTLHIAQLRIKLVKSVPIFFLATSTFAANGHFYVGGMLGASRASLGKSSQQITYDNGALTDRYPLSGNDSTVANVGVGGGYEFEGKGWVPAIGLGVGFYTLPTEYSFSGIVTETPLGGVSSPLYNYHYNISSTRLMLESQFNWFYHQFFPFINIGVGPAWNRLYGYSESSVSKTGFVALGPFRSNTDTNVAYQIGIGAGYAFNFTRSTSDFLHERISLMYRYVNLGNTSFGTRGGTYPYKLNTGRLTANEIELVFTHLI